MSFDLQNLASIFYFFSSPGMKIVVDFEFVARKLMKRLFLGEEWSNQKMDCKFSGFSRLSCSENENLM